MGIPPIFLRDSEATARLQVRVYHRTERTFVTKCKYKFCVQQALDANCVYVEAIGGAFSQRSIWQMLG